MTQPKPKKLTMWVVEAQSIYGDWHPWVQATESEMLTSVEMLRNDEPEMKFRLRKYVRGGLMKKPRPSIKRFVSYWGRDAGLDVLMRRDLLALLREARSDAAAKERVKACHVGCPPARKRGGAE